MAFIAASYALYMIFVYLLTSIFFGIIWGLLIFNLDRYIVSTIKKRDNIIDEIIQASPKGEYDSKSELKTWAQQNSYQRHILLNADIAINDRIYGDISTKEERYAYKKKWRINL